MSDSNTGKGTTIKLIGYAAALSLAAAVCVAAILYGRGEQIEYNRDANERHREYSRNTYYPALDSCVKLPFQDQSDCVAQATNAARENERQEQDLVAQRVTAIWTFLMGCAAIVGMGLSIVGVFLVWTTFRAAREGNEISRNALIAERRPWLELTDVQITSLVMEPTRMVIGISISAENIGNSPAKNINAMCRLATFHSVDFFGAIDRFAEKFRHEARTKDGQFCFPNEEVPIDMNLSNGFEEIDADLTKRHIGGDTPRTELEWPILFGSVTYQMHGFDDVYQTAFSFEIAGRGPDGSPVTGIRLPRAHHTYSASDFCLVPSRIGILAE